VTKRCLRTGVVATLSLGVLLRAASAQATPINLGLLTVDAGVGTANDSFAAIHNYTGTNNLPDDFPVLEDVTFIDWTLTLTLTATASDAAEVRTIASATLGPIGPGDFLDPSPPGGLPFAPFVFAPDRFGSAMFTATIDRTALSTALASYLVDSLTLTATLDDPGAFAVLFVDATEVVASPDPNTPVPEPGTCALVAAGAAMLARRRSARKRRP
jgi:hypothetical protein